MSLMRYPGGKVRLAKRIVARLIEAWDGEIKEYREPFLGGANVALALLRHPIGIERIWGNDADAGVGCLWTAAIRWPEWLKDRIRGFAPSVEAFYQFRDALRALDTVPPGPEDVVEAGFMKLAVHRMSRSGLGTRSGGPMGGRDQPKGGIASRWNRERLCREVDDAHALLSMVEVVGDGCTSLDSGEVLKDDTEPALVYLDPPYYQKGSLLYQYSFCQDDHERLARLLRESGHRWLLSYDDAPAIRDLYAWANLEAIEVGYSVNGCHRTKELLITPRHDTLVRVVGDGMDGSLGAAASVAVPSVAASV